MRPQNQEKAFIQMAKKLADINEKIAEGVVGGYNKIENGVVGGYKKIAPPDPPIGGRTDEII